jgi:hypothetical protein
MPRCSVHGRRKLGAHRLRHDRRRAPLEERRKSLQDDALETVGEAVLRWCEGDLEHRLSLLRGARPDGQLIGLLIGRRWRRVAHAPR